MARNAWLAVLALCAACGCASVDRYRLIGVQPDRQVAIVFDSETGDLSVRPLPKLPETGQQEVRQ